MLQATGLQRVRQSSATEQQLLFKGLVADVPTSPSPARPCPGLITGSNRDAEGLRLGVGRGLRESHMREGGNCILKDGAALAHGDWLEDSRAMAMKGA